MELKQVYEMMQGDYDSVMGRLMTQERVVKYLNMFVKNNMLELITNALDEKDYEVAFREAHNLKGVCANLNMDKLGHSAGELTESLRHGEPTIDITPLLEEVREDYQLTVDAISLIEQ